MPTGFPFSVFPHKHKESTYAYSLQILLISNPRLDLDWTWIGVGLELDWSWYDLTLKNKRGKFICILQYSLSSALLFLLEYQSQLPFRHYDHLLVPYL